MLQRAKALHHLYGAVPGHKVGSYVMLPLLDANGKSLPKPLILKTMKMYMAAAVYLASSCLA